MNFNKFHSYLEVLNWCIQKLGTHGCTSTVDQSCDGSLFILYLYKVLAIQLYKP